MAPLPARRPATYEDILALPPHVNGEIVDGELHVSPRPAGLHAIASSTLGMDLGSAYQRGRGGPGGWWIVFEPELHPGRDVLVPDLAGWRRERLPVFPEEAFITLPPDWVCEVVSPSSARFDRVKKMDAYARAGVAHAWLVDPEAQTLEAFRLLEDGRWVRVAAFEGAEPARAEPFPEVGIPLSDLWPGKAVPEG